MYSLEFLLDLSKCGFIYKSQRSIATQDTKENKSMSMEILVSENLAAVIGLHVHENSEPNSPDRMRVLTEENSREWKCRAAKKKMYPFKKSLFWPLT